MAPLEKNTIAVFFLLVSMVTGFVALTSSVNPRSQLAALDGAGSGLVGWWKFDEGSGTAASDSSGNNNKGTLMPTATPPTWTTGQIGQALSFNGINNFVVTPTDPIGTSAVTISAWINPSKQFGRIVTNAKFDFMVDTDSNRLLLTSNGLVNARSANGSIVLNNMVHVVGTRDANGIASLYINGILSGSANQNSGAPTIGVSNISIGATISSAGPFGGVIDNVRIYNRVLSASEISDLYNQDLSGVGSTPTPTPTSTPIPTPTPSLDTQSPTIPANLNAIAISSSQINLSWTASTDNVAVIGYNIYRGGVQVGTSVTNSFSDSGLSASTAYTYTVSAYDAVPNTSAQSSNANATTQAQSNLTAFYVDYSRSSNGDGSQSNPWKNRSSINWTSVQNALNNNDITVYFSSRGVWSDNEMLNIGASGSSAHTLTLDGNSEYNLNSSGIAQWRTETVIGNKAVLTNSGGTGGSVYLVNGANHVTIRGFELLYPTWGGVNIGTANPTQNIDHIIIDNMYIDSPVNNHGVWMGYAEDGVHDIIVRNSTIKNTPLEGIYMGHYSYMSSTITGVIIENNTLIDTGLNGQGDIDIKPGVYGAIIRGNSHYRTSSSVTGSNDGVVVGADGVQIYDNSFYMAAQNNSGNDWGDGIYINADGDGTGNGHGITSALIYNNVVYGNDQSGIKLLATTATAGADLKGVRIYNNTIWNNNAYGITASAQNGRSVEIQDLKNNIIGENALNNIHVDGNANILDTNNNLYYKSTGDSWYYKGTKTWPQWQALGFDLSGIQNINPLFINSLSNDFHLQINSSAVNAGTDLSLQGFNLDKDNVSRPQGSAWDIGSYEYIGGDSPTPTPTSTPTPTPTPIIPPILSADLNQNGRVNAQDFSILLSYWGVTTKPPADINQNGIVNAQDFSIMLSQWTG